MQTLIWLLVIVAAILTVRWYQTGKAPWMWFLFAALLPFAAVMHAPAALAQTGCIPGAVAAAMLGVQAEAIGGKVETIADPAALARYVAVIDEEPPPVGQVDRLLILVHPVLGLALVVPVHDEIACRRFMIAPDMHERAWSAAHGRGAVLRPNGKPL